MLFEIIGKTSGAVCSFNIASPQDLVVCGQMVDSFGLQRVQLLNNLYNQSLRGPYIRLNRRGTREKEGRREGMVVVDVVHIMIDM